MSWFFILACLLVVILLLSRLSPFRQFIAKKWDIFSAWDRSTRLEARHKNVVINEKKKEFFSGMEEVIDRIGGPVLEIGCGAGQNLPFFPQNTRLITCDLNEHFKPYLLENLEKHNIKLQKYTTGNAEDLRGIVQDNSCSVVVSSFLLCCVESQDNVLREIMRVLKPGGRFYFIEHVIAPPGTWDRLGQKLLTPIWAFFKSNCRLDRDTKIIEQFGFENFHSEIWYRPIPLYFYFSRRGYFGYGEKPLK